MRFVHWGSFEKKTLKKGIRKISPTFEKSPKWENFKKGIELFENFHPSVKCFKREWLISRMDFLIVHEHYYKQTFDLMHYRTINCVPIKC